MIIERVTLSWRQVDGPRRGRRVICKATAERLIRCAQLSAWPNFHFRYEPHEDHPMILPAWLLFGLSFIAKHWEALLFAVLAVAWAAIVIFAPTWERPVLVSLPLLTAALGVLAGKKYFAKS
jgi:hypothetical protein